MHLNKAVRIEGDDKIVDAMLVKDFSTYAWIVTVSSNGQIKKTPVENWKVERNSRVMTAMKVPSGEQMITAFAAYAGEEILLVSRDGFSCRFPLDQIPSTGVKSKGVKAMNLGKGDKVAFACALAKDDPAVLFTTVQGAMKRVHMDEIAEGTRPMKGNLICKRVKSNPSVIRYAHVIHPGEELIFCDPEIQKIKASDIPLKPRESGFSTPLVLKPGWDILKGITEVRIIDIPADSDDTVHDDVEKISLF